MTARLALPIDPVLPDVVHALRKAGRVVLEAPPGAGKTTRVPLALLEAGTPGKILMLEPRRLAARAAAGRMAETLGEPVGHTIGYRMRGENRTSATTRIEVVTEGILTRMLQSDPELPGISTLIFDEFHERSLAADLGLALAWEVRGALREDLGIVVMSATLDAGPIATMLDAPVVTAKGRSFPVDIHHLDRALPPRARRPEETARVIESALADHSGSLLAFLPGEREIRRCEAALRLPEGCEAHALYGALPFAAQKAAIDPAPAGERKVVLATAIAETSLTLPDIRIVVDAGQARRARFDPGSGMSRLVTEKVTRAEATQRAGRAGRVAPGVCYRLWTKGQEAALAAHPPAEIEAADLAPLALELALWGSDGSDLAFLTPPPVGALAEARGLLQSIGALDADLRLTDHGRALAAIPVHPRLGHMLTLAGPQMAALAALLQARDPVVSREVSLSLRMEALKDPAAARRDRGLELREGALKDIKAEARRLSGQLGRVAARANVAREYSLAEAAALAYPDRIGQRRKGDAPRYILSGGKGAFIDEADPMANAPLIVALDLDGDAREARVRLAVPLPEASLRKLYTGQITQQNVCYWSKRDGRVLARQQEIFGALQLADQPWVGAPEQDIARAMLDGIRQIGLHFGEGAKRLQARILQARQQGLTDLPDVSDTALMNSLEDWLLPHIGGLADAGAWKRFDATPALSALLGWDAGQRLAALYPAHFTTPLGRKIPIDYDGESPAISLRLQELFGQTRHPTFGADHTPLQITLLSPAGRPVQVTRDLPGFWASSYADVRKDMRGRYPKHPWPEDPTNADPTLRAKRRK